MKGLQAGSVRSGGRETWATDGDAGSGLEAGAAADSQGTQNGPLNAQSISAITILYIAMGVVGILFVVAVVGSFPRHHVRPPNWIEVAIGADHQLFR